MPSSSKPISISKKTRPDTAHFTLQYVAGHDNIKITARYVHSRKAAVHKLFARLADLERPEERVACKNSVELEVPSQNELAKI